MCAQVRGLFLMMGRGLERLAQVPAGCCLAIGGLERAILKSATLASTPAARPLAPMLFQVRRPRSLPFSWSRRLHMPQADQPGHVEIPKPADGLRARPGSCTCVCTFRSPPVAALDACCYSRQLLAAVSYSLTRHAWLQALVSPQAGCVRVIETG